MKEEQKWNEVLNRQIERAGGIMPFFIQKCICQKVWHQVLKKYANKSIYPKILEVGCGFAWDSIYLSYFYNNVSAMDIDAEVVEKAKELNEFLRGKATIGVNDLFSKFIDNYCIIFNNGTYEHFKRKEIERAIKNHLEHTKYVIFLVPLDMSRDKEPYGDELLMPEREWRKIIENAGGRTLEVYGIDFPRWLAFAGYIPIFSKVFKDFANYRIFVTGSGKKGE
jgi:SAM-dependent methyltransferase